MPESRAERTHGRWPVWLTLLLLAAAAGWMFTLGWNRLRPGTNPAPATVPNTVYQQRVTDLLTVTTAPDKRELSGRRVQLGHVRVDSLAGGGGFWVGPAVGEKVLVLPEEPETAMEPIRVGQTVAIIGTLERPEFALPEGAPPIARDQEIYIQATAITPMEDQGSE